MGKEQSQEFNLMLKSERSERVLVLQFSKCGPKAIHIGDTRELV